MAYLNEISDAAYSIWKTSLQSCFDCLVETLETVKASELTNCKSCDVINNDNDNDYDDVDISIITSKDLYKLIVSFKEFLKELKVIGLNSGLKFGLKQHSRTHACIMKNL